jgi:hypothetical protein
VPLIKSWRQKRLPLLGNGLVSTYMLQGMERIPLFFSAIYQYLDACEKQKLGGSIPPFHRRLDLSDFLVTGLNILNQLSTSICACGNLHLPNMTTNSGNLSAGKVGLRKTKKRTHRRVFLRSLSSLQICCLCWKFFWIIVNIYMKVHENEFTVASYLPLSWSESSIHVEVAEFLTISGHFPSQYWEASHTVWSPLQFRQSKIPLEVCYFANV